VVGRRMHGICMSFKVAVPNGTFRRLMNRSGARVMYVTQGWTGARDVTAAVMRL